MTIWQKISVAEAERMIDDTNIMVFDMRDIRSYLAGHQRQAMHLSSNNLRAVLKQNAKHIPILIYCYHGHSSQDMAQLFTDFGFDNVYSLDGGYESWVKVIKPPKIELSDSLKQWMSSHQFDADNLELRGWNNETALLRAAREGDYAYCEELLRAGADVKVKNKDGNDALWMACVSNSAAVIQLLIEHKVSLNNQNDNGATALIYCASAGKTALVRQLVQAGADFNLATLDDFTALSVAANRDILKFLRTLTVPSNQKIFHPHLIAI